MWPEPDNDPIEDVPCPKCGGSGYALDDEGRPADGCDACGASGEVKPAHADQLARQRQAARPPVYLEL